MEGTVIRWVYETESEGSESDFEGQWSLRLITDFRARMSRRVLCVFPGTRSEAGMIGSLRGGMRCGGLGPPHPLIFCCLDDVLELSTVPLPGVKPQSKQKQTNNKREKEKERKRKREREREREREKVKEKEKEEN